MVRAYAWRMMVERLLRILISAIRKQGFLRAMCSETGGSWPTGLGGSSPASAAPARTWGAARTGQRRLRGPLQTCRSADEILAALTDRLGNDPDTELGRPAEEHRRITRLRIERLLEP